MFTFWWLNYCRQHRLPYLGISLAFIVPSIPLFLQEGEMLCDIGSILLGIGVILLILVFFIPSRNAVPPQEHSFRKCQDILGLWYTGRDTLESGLIEKYASKIRKILLLNPESAGFEKNMEETTGHSQSSKYNIIRLTKVAQRKGICVKWYDDNLNKSLTFYNAISNKKPYFIWQEGKPNTPAAMRPRYKFTKKHDKGEFNDNITQFHDIWNSSHEPNIQESNND